jgi:hypothetical protein
MSKDPPSSAFPFAIATISIATFAGRDVLIKGLSIEMVAARQKPDQDDVYDTHKLLTRLRIKT